MTDIICLACGHNASAHRNGKCEACTCPNDEGWILRLHIIKLEAVVEAARELDRKMQGFTLPTSALSAAQELVDALAALDSTNVP